MAACGAIAGSERNEESLVLIKYLGKTTKRESAEIRAAESDSSISLETETSDHRQLILGRAGSRSEAPAVQRVQRRNLLLDHAVFQKPISALLT